MAIIFDESTCSICGNALEEEQIVSWTAFLPKEHKFWKYSDSAMHKTCFENWKFKDEFSKLYKYQPFLDLDNDEIKKFIKENGTPEWITKIIEYRHTLETE